MKNIFGEEISNVILETKKCPYCISEINLKAKVCPICRRKIKTGIAEYIVGIFILIIIIPIIYGIFTALFYS